MKPISITPTFIGLSRESVRFCLFGIKNLIFNTKQVAIVFALLLAFITGVYSQNTYYTFTGPGNWTDASKWSPASPPNPLGNGDVININGDCNINTNYTIGAGGTLANYGTLNNEGILGNYGTLNNEGTLNNSSFNTLSNFSSGILNNNPSGTMNNYGYLDNYGTLNNSASGILNNFAGWLSNYSGGTLLNNGIMTNDIVGNMDNYSTLTNNGTFNLNGLLYLNTTNATLPDGTFNWNSGGTVIIGNWSVMTVTNLLTIPSGRNFRIGGTLNISSGGTLVNSGTMIIEGYLTNDGTLINDGTTTNNAFLNNYGYMTNNAEKTMTNNSNLTNMTGGTFLNNGILINYSSTLNNTFTKILSQDGILNNNSGSTLSNDGTLTNDGYLNNYGTLTNNSGKTLTNNAILTNDGGTLDNNGTLNNNGTLLGTGTVVQSGTFSNNSTGMIAPGLSPGKLTVTGSLNLGNGTYNCEINGTNQGTNYDWLAISGTTTLTNAKLILNWGFTPVAGDEFTILTYSSKVGEFAPGNVTIPSVSGLIVALIQDATFVKVTVYAPLPVKLADFSGSIRGGDVYLEWETSIEQNNQGFEILRSTNAGNWSSIGFVESHGGLNGNRYEYLDTEPMAGPNYYRLRQLDYDGRVELSDIVMVLCKDAKYILHLYPNPVQSHVSLTNLEGQTLYSIINEMGQTLQSGTTSGGEVIDVQSLPSGMYYLQAGNQVLKFIKQ